MVSNMNRDRPAYSLHGNLLYNVKERTFRRLRQTSSKDTGLLQLSSSPRAPIHSITYYPIEQSVMVGTPAASWYNSIYELYPIPVNVECPQERIEGKRSTGVSAIWIARNLRVCDKIFYAGTGCVSLFFTEGPTLFYIQQNQRGGHIKEFLEYRKEWLVSTLTAAVTPHRPTADSSSFHHPLMGQSFNKTAAAANRATDGANVIHERMDTVHFLQNSWFRSEDFRKCFTGKITITIHFIFIFVLIEIL